MENSRRDFLKKSAVAGGIVWASPVLTSLPAFAQTRGTPVPCPGQCTGGARGGYLFLPIVGAHTFGQDLDPAADGPRCTLAANVNTSPPVGDPLANSGTLCGELNGCDANARVEGLVLLGEIPITAALITSSVSGAETGCPTGTSSILNVTVGGTALVDGSAAPNSTIFVDTPLGQAKVVVNEQVCEDGQLVVRGVHVTVTGPGGGVIAEVILAESRAGNTCCPDCGLAA